MKTANGSSSPPGAWRFQAQDFAWLMFVGVLIAASPEVNYDALILLPLIGAFQIVEPRLKIFASRRGQIVSITLKMVLCYLLIGFTHTFNSFYFPVFFIPMVSAATTFEAAGVFWVTAIACVASFSFLLFLPLFVPYNEIDFLDYLSVMGVRTMFYAIVSFLVYQQAKAKRDEMQRTQAAAASLAKANEELREAQASLRRSERLAALGQLTAGLAHELRNPLGTIRASAEMLQKPAVKTKPEVMDEMAGYISAEVDRMNGLVASFLDFARPLQIHPAESNLTEVLEQVEREQAELAAARDTPVMRKNGTGSLVFRFDPELMRLALSNLLQNAIQASAPGKAISIETEMAGQDVKIWVADEGEGILPEHLENVFNPFFTTKPKGVGLGLALVAKIVDEHGGRIHVSSERGKGTRFEVVLPRK
ncbi:MAG TPA: ATP-binding protein [Bryobacteraceae bacterium]|jgi:signal transduction histidine kinase|nr:ATP-binding protein [Bryobacteraceae bacterium]